MTTEIADKGIHEGKLMWPSLRTADWLFSVSNIALVVGLTLTVVATVGSVWMANVRDGYLKRELAEANTRIADASARGDEARSEAAKANERAAGLEVEAANARLAQEQLKAQLAWRVIPQDTTAKLIAFLAKSPGLKVNVQVVANDQEAQYLAIQVANIFAAAKWQIGMLSASFTGAVTFGIWVPNAGDAATIKVVRDAFADSGIALATGDLPPSGMGLGQLLPADEAATVFIGSKPLPQ